MNMDCGREIRWDNNSRGYSIQHWDGTPEELLTHMVGQLIIHDADTFKPRVKWWQLWREKLHSNVTNEYIRQINI